VRYHSFSILFIFLFSFGKSFAETLSDLPLSDAIYSETIKTVVLYPGSATGDDPTRYLRQPVVALDQNLPLTLEFDDLSPRGKSFRAKFIHCNADWSKSVLSDVEFTYEYNDYPITDFRQSFSTKVPYNHYVFQLPKLKLSGNYLLIVYDDGDRKPVLSRRFMVFEPLLKIGGGVVASSGIQEQRTAQQLDFSISHKGFPLASPQTDLKIVIRKNFRWDQSKTGFRPSSVNPFDQTLDFQFFKLENNFPGGNEFRYFDSRTLAGRGFGIQAIERSDEYTELILQVDKPRAQSPYFQTDDFNGYYIVDHRESRNGSLQGDYTPVEFTLKAEEIPDREVYVNGAFNLWQLNEVNRMTYDPDNGVYHAIVMIKQGVVNYQYVIGFPDQGTSDEVVLEGNFAATENDYDVLVYFRPPAGRADRLVGYRTFEWNRR
jgi:hypothetical protein